MVVLLLYTFIAAIFSFALIYLSMEIRKKDRHWMRDYEGDLSYSTCIAIAIFWPFTIFVAFAVVAAKMLFDKET